jgi:hypothetical protein
MKHKNLMVSIMGSFILFLIIGCAKVPQREINAAKAAIEEARVEKADLYAKDGFKDAQDAFDKAMAEIEEQKSKTFPNYGMAKTMLQSTTVTANTAKAEVAKGKERIRSDVYDFLAQIGIIIEELKKLCPKKPRDEKAKDKENDIKTDIELLEAFISDIKLEVENGELISARNSVQAALKNADAFMRKFQPEI